MKNVVISGINLDEAGPLSIYLDCLRSIVNMNMYKNLHFILFVNKKELFKDYLTTENFEFIELPKSKKNYIYRIWYEYLFFYFFSRSKHIETWLSLHDITPNVIAKKRYVYCHNALPFMEFKIGDIKYSFKNFLFSIFYKYLYRLNINKNDAVIVQQDWLREKFIKLFNLKSVIVSRPNISHSFDLAVNDNSKLYDHYTFIYPAFPRFFKNFEVICEACKVLNNKGIANFRVLLTIDGKENRYSSEIVSRYENLTSIKFIGLQSRSELFNIYSKIDSLIFPSKLETWGLPISEFKLTGKPIILSDLPYAHETLGVYDKGYFFDCSNPLELADVMLREIKGQLVYSNVKSNQIKSPYYEGWESLLKEIFH